MQSLLTAQQMKAADAYTIAHQRISSVDLMENAARAFVKVLEKEVQSKGTRIAFLCGKGNNGGDGLAIARLLHEKQYLAVSVYLINFSEKASEDYRINLKRLAATNIPIVEVNDAEALAALEADLLIDAVLGSGLSRQLEGRYQKLAKIVNQLAIRVIAVDVPTGFFTEGPINENQDCIKAALVISFQRPKINFFFPESASIVQRFKVVAIGLAEDFIENQNSRWKLVNQSAVLNRLRVRKNFSHKGTYGHALLIAGNVHTMGAALLAASACLHTGAGLTTVCLPESGLTALNTALPEVMALPRDSAMQASSFERYNAIGIGPGWGASQENEQLVEAIVSLKKRMVVDADGLTLLSTRKDLFDQLANGSILTPHVKEFDRIFGFHHTWFERVETASKAAVQRQIIIVLKNQFTFICLPNGEIVINSTGNPAMASGGMGDVLTGMIVSFLAQSYSPADATILAVYVHGLTGDELAKTREVVTASEVAAKIPKTMKRMRA